ncbi:hypothetical protein GQ42DRAFT_77406 [Ramicandelaber brevisporus]|nr:hypothetical protein GQ42DRAFT_77406 [Ramicandelaber brevisporus]
MSIILSICIRDLFQERRVITNSRGPSLLDDIVRWLMLTDVGSIVTKTAGVCVGIVGSTMLNRWIAPSTSATVRWLVSCSTGLTLSSGLWMLLRAAANRVQVSTQHRYQSAVTRLISSTQQCDMLIARSLRVIKEYELVRRGFHLSGSSQPRQQLLLPPVTRIEHTEETALEPTCPGLRRSIDDTLETLRQQYLTALVDSTQLDLAPEDTDEEDSQYHSTHSLVSLRESMFALHDIRREYLFHAAMPAISPRSLFLDSLASLSEQLEAIANNTDILSNRLSLRLTSELGVQKDSFLSSINTHSISHALPSHDIVWRHFGNLETTIRSIHIQCRLIVDSLQSDTEFSDILLRYNQLGTEIDALRSQWEAGQQIIAALNDPDHRSAIPNHASSASSHHAETGTGSDQADLGRHDISEQPHPTSILFDFANQAQSDSLDLADSFDLESSAGNAASEECHGSRSGLTRAERILIQKAKRAEDSRLRTERQKIDGLVSELKDVLSKRATDSIK